MIFDSVYDTYRGVVTYVRVVDGMLTTRNRIKMLSTGATHELLEIVRERLEREFNLDLIATAPNVIYHVKSEDGTITRVDNPSEYPEGKIAEVHEPIVQPRPDRYRAERYLPRQE